jgi:hypothetical protein
MWIGNSLGFARRSRGIRDKGQSIEVILSRQRRRRFLGVTVGVCRGLVESDQRDIGLDLVCLGAVSHHNHGLRVFKDVCQEIRRISQLENKECASCTKSGQAGDHIMGAPREKHANQAISSDSIASQALSQSIDFVV